MKIWLASTVGALLGFLPASGQAQLDSRWQVFVMGGIYSPIEEEVENIYGSSFQGLLALSSPLGDFGRMKVVADFLQTKGDPYYRNKDFRAGDAATLSLRSVALLIETSGRSANNPRLFLGAGLVYAVAREKIVGVSSNPGDGIGVQFAVAPEVRLLSRISLVADAAYRFLQLTFRNDKDRYRLNLSGGSLKFGLAYHFGA